MVNKLKELRNSGSEEGFTLIELMIVVVIIGILAAIAIPIFMNQQKGAIVAGVKSDVKNTHTNIVTALVKAPTASSVAATAAAANGTISGGHTFAVVKSDTNTTIVVSGGWSTYYVMGTNSSVNEVPLAAPSSGRITNTTEFNKVIDDGKAADAFGIIFSTVTGKTATVGG